jgi:hypothetical protein
VASVSHLDPASGRFRVATYHGSTPAGENFELRRGTAYVIHSRLPIGELPLP